ncbi:hypothetical protein WMY93_024015 [Mugilogobius chulae]|uniref:Rab-GAP TBC domain-containing protein n=1 Tax=Mugilogobius chulae TaxID=88201 RepID=A0AAW0NI54_9GOBI
MRYSVDDITLFRQIALDLQRSFPTHRSLMGDSPEAIEARPSFSGFSLPSQDTALRLGTVKGSELFDLNLSKVQHQVKVFEQLLKHRKPTLSQHLESVGLLSVHFVMPWFLTLFTSLPCWDSVLAVWDFIILHDPPSAQNENALPSSSEKDSGGRGVLSRVLHMAKRFLLDPINRQREDKKSSSVSWSPASGRGIRSKTSASLTQVQIRARRRSQHRSGTVGNSTDVATSSSSDGRRSCRSNENFKRSDTGPHGGGSRRSNHSLIQPLRVRSLRLLRSNKDSMKNTPNSTSVLPQRFARPLFLLHPLLQHPLLQHPPLRHPSLRHPSPPGHRSRTGRSTPGELFSMSCPPNIRPGSPSAMSESQHSSDEARGELKRSKFTYH